MAEQEAGPPIQQSTPVLERRGTLSSDPRRPLPSRHRNAPEVLWRHLRTGLPVLVLLAVPASVVLLLGAVGPGSEMRHRTPSEAAPSAHRQDTDTALTDAACAPPPRGHVSSAGERLDVDGDGCPETVVITAGHVHVIHGGEGVAGAERGRGSPVGAGVGLDGGRADGSRVDGAGSDGGGAVSFALGSATDQILVGDWDCNGAATPLLYRPDSGTIYRFDRWPQTMAPVHPAIETGPPHGQATRRTDDGCHHVDVVAAP